MGRYVTDSELEGIRRSFGRALCAKNSTEELARWAADHGPDLLNELRDLHNDELPLPRREAVAAGSAASARS